MEEYIFIALKGGKVVGKPCYSLGRLCKNLGIAKLSPKELPVVSKDFSIECHIIDKKL